MPVHCNACTSPYRVALVGLPAACRLLLTAATFFSPPSQVYNAVWFMHSAFLYLHNALGWFHAAISSLLLSRAHRIFCVLLPSLATDFRPFILTGVVPRDDIFC
jgi:hypothetical protein